MICLQDPLQIAQIPQNAKKGRGKMKAEVARGLLLHLENEYLQVSNGVVTHLKGEEKLLKALGVCNSYFFLRKRGDGGVLRPQKQPQGPLAYAPKAIFCSSQSKEMYFIVSCFLFFLVVVFLKNSRA